MAESAQVSIGTESLEEERARGKQSNLRSIHVTERGIWFDEAFIPHIAISTDVKLSSVGNRQQITLTVNADELTFEGKAHATIAVPDANSSEAWPDTKEQHESRRARDESTLAGEYRVSETYSHIERDPEYLAWLEARGPRSRPAGFSRHTNEPCSTRPVTLEQSAERWRHGLGDQRPQGVASSGLAQTASAGEEAIRRAV